MTLVDKRKLDAASLESGKVAGDLCIIGAGAAGLAIARHYVGRHERVIMLESGGEAADPATQALNQGTVVGQSHAPLDAGRLRGLGGTTGHWTAHVRRLDPLDFSARPWDPPQRLAEPPTSWDEQRRPQWRHPNRAP